MADWGPIWRPRGQTTRPDRTQADVAFGTDGGQPPELSSDAHTAGPQADVYSIGQDLGWAVTGMIPQANTPLIPLGGPWRTRNEIARLFAGLTIEHPHDDRHQIRWSNWRRRHQHRAKTCHYQRQAAQDP